MAQDPEKRTVGKEGALMTPRAMSLLPGQLPGKMTSASGPDGSFRPL
jgi:hypothetical protein